MEAESGREPRQGNIAVRKCHMSPLVGLSQQQAISYPSAVALGHIMAALTGLIARTPIRYRTRETQGVGALLGDGECQNGNPG